MIYLYVALHTVCISYLYARGKKKKVRRTEGHKYWFSLFALYLIMIIPPILVSGFRYGISVDYFKVYQKGFLRILSTVGNTSDFEYGFYLIVRILGKIVAEPWFIFFSISFITILLYFKSFNQSKDYFVSVLLFFGTGVYLDSFNGIRQYLVVAVFMYCFKYIKKREWKKYFLIMFLCGFIHTSAFFTLPLYFIDKIKIHKIKTVIICAILLILQSPLQNMIKLLLSMIPKYNEYLLRNTLDNYIVFSVSGLIMALAAIVPCIMAEKKMHDSVEGTFLYSMVFLGLIIAVCSSFLPFAERILYYTRSYIILAVPYACSGFKKKKKLYTQTLSVGLMTSMNVLGIIFMNWYAILPYQSIF